MTIAYLRSFDQLGWLTIGARTPRMIIQASTRLRVGMSGMSVLLLCSGGADAYVHIDMGVGHGVGDLLDVCVGEAGGFE